MTAAVDKIRFKRAVYISIAAHLAIFILILISPHLPKPSRKGLVHYVPINLVAGGGGSGGRRGAPAVSKPVPPAKKETLRDLTTPQKAQPEPKPGMRYPVDKPAKEAKKKTDKKAAITKPEPAPPEKSAQAGAKEGAAAEGEGEGGYGTGLRIGGGTGPGDWGPGVGLANFPYTYYLNIITDRVSANWFTSLVDPGVSGNFQTVVYFRIQRNGQISDVKIEQSSGLTPLDLSALRAVGASAPFPPLPKDYDDAYLAIHLIFEHSR
ncbi:MAG: TonB family protein [Acidobacteriota bacterium]